MSNNAYTIRTELYKLGWPIYKTNRELCVMRAYKGVELEYMGSSNGSE